MNHTTATADSIRNRPAYQVVKLMKLAGTTQIAIATQVGCTQAVVSRVINRQPGSYSRATADRVWVAIARAVAHVRAPNA